MHQIETPYVQGGAACSPVQSGFGMNRSQLTDL